MKLIHLINTHRPPSPALRPAKELLCPVLSGCVFVFSCLPLTHSFVTSANFTSCLFPLPGPAPAAPASLAPGGSDRGPCLPAEGAAAPRAIVCGAAGLPSAAPAGPRPSAGPQERGRGPPGASVQRSPPATQSAIVQRRQSISLRSSPTVTLERKIICRKIAPAGERLLLPNVG